MKTILTTACLFSVTFVALVSFISPPVFGQETKPANVNPSPADSVTPHVSGAPAANKPSLEGLDEFIVEQMKEWNVPGLAMAIVRDGKVTETFFRSIG